MSSNVKLLLVEPSEDLRKSLKTYFEKQKYKVDEGATPEDLVKKAKKTSYSCIVTALDFPDTDPLEFIKSAKEAAGESPIVLLTEKATVKIAVDAMQEGANNIVQKPLMVKEVAEVVEQALDLTTQKNVFENLMSYTTTQDSLEVPGTLGNIESIIDHLYEQILHWDIIEKKEEVAFKAVLRCALHNAVIHGNKGNEKKQIRVRFLIKQKECFIAISDEGIGFNYSNYLTEKGKKLTPDQMTTGLARICCYMDEVSFNQRGNQIRMKKLKA